MPKYQKIKKSDISVILLLYNTPSENLKNLLNYKDFKLLILDQSNDRATKKKITKLLPKIEYYKLTKNNEGFAKGINFLSSKVKTKFFLCTQIDVLINKRSINKLTNAFTQNNDCVISVPNFNHNKKIKIKSKTISRINRFIGAIFLAEKLKFDKIGKFDDNFFFYWEDEDLSKRIESLKKSNIYKCKNSFAKHMNGSSTKFSNKTNFIRLTNFKFGEYLFQYKHKKLKIIKIIREPIIRIIASFFYMIILQKNKFYKNFYFFLGIIKFYNFIFFKNK